MSEGTNPAQRPEIGNAPSAERLALVIMGVSGSGKTTVGQALAARLGLAFVDGDDLHPPANVAKMAAGTPLDDADRWPWLDRVGAALANTTAHPAGLAVACSALRRIYRDRIRAAAGKDVRFLYLVADEAEMVRRLEGRPHHYMPPSLVHSQFAALEPPDPAQEADVLAVPASGPPEDKVDAAVRWLGSEA